jgi:two-component system, NtrC family, sensor histidine kinase KinB
MPSPISELAVLSLNSMLKECTSALRRTGGIRRCSIILIDEDHIHGSPCAGFDLKDPYYPAAGRKISIGDYAPLKESIAGRSAKLVRNPFAGGSTMPWEEIENVEQISALAILPILKVQKCIGVVCLASEDPIDEMLDVRFRAWQVCVEFFSMAIASYSAYLQTLNEKADLENVLNGISHGILILDQDRKIHLANPVIGEMVGKASHELVGVPYEWLCSETGILSEPCPVLEGMTEGKVTHAVKRCQVKGTDREERYLKISCFPQKNLEGNVTHAIVYIRDVSQIVKAEMLQKDLTHMIVHDIRNPILSTARTLDMTVAGSNGWIPPHHRELLTATRDSCELLLDMLDDMLDIYAHEAGQLYLNHQRFDLPKLIQRAYKTIEALVEEKAIRMQFDLSQGLPMIYGDEARFIRVMVNILDNAVKFAPKNSSVIVKTWINSEGWLQASVSNSGKAIPPEHLERIFWKFYRIDKEIGIKKAGMGLGLAFCRLAVEAHGGQIWAESPISPDGTGSRFLFKIPIGQPEGLTA